MSSLTNKVWFVTDAAGRPLGVKMYYNGNWRPVYSGAYGDIKIYSGALSPDFDVTGRGIIGNWHDGWAICNGQNGTPNLANRFIVGGNWDGVGWQTTITGAASYLGGQAPYTLVGRDIPPLIVPAHTLTVQAGSGAQTTFSAVGGSGDPIGEIWLVTDAAEVQTGKPAPQNNLMLPPYISFGYLMWIGYA